MLKLFDVLPDKFFNLLTGSNKDLYAEAALLLYEHSQRERFGIRYEVMRDVFQELIESHRALGWEIEFDDEESADPASQQEQLTMEELSRSQANALIRRLDALKWINVEERDQYEKYIVLPHYSSRMLALLQDLCEARAVEYQRFAFVTYQLMTGEEAKRRPCFAVQEAKNMTQQFQQELITLYNNMKHHMEQVVQQTSIEDVLDHHFDVYKKQIVDQSYHRLKTSDHVSRYRFQILQTVQQWLLDKEWLEETIEDGLASQFYTDRQGAEQDIRSSLFAIEEIFNGLDDIFYQIDLRHNQYLRSSYDRARYLSQHHQGMDQLLAEVLESYSRIHHANTMRADENFPWPELFQLQTSDLLSEASLLPPRKKRPPHRAEKHIVVPMSDELKAQLREQSLARMRKAITRQKVEGYVLDKLGERKEMELLELAPGSIDEFLLLSYVYLYGQDGGSVFQLKRNRERCILHVGRYRFDNHRIQRKAKRKG